LPILVASTHRPSLDLDSAWNQNKKKLEKQSRYPFYISLMKAAACSVDCFFTHALSGISLSQFCRAAGAPNSANGYLRSQGDTLDCSFTHALLAFYLEGISGSRYLIMLYVRLTKTLYLMFLSHMQ
jgi:hypothetical protein